MCRSSTSSRHPNATSATTTDDEEHDCNRGLWDPRHDPQREVLMAWFRRMGVDEVAYHQATVVGRADDHAGQALDYYGSRGERSEEHTTELQSLMRLSYAIICFTNKHNHLLERPNQQNHKIK